MWRFRDHNGPFVLNKIILVQTIIIRFIYLFTFHSAKFKKKSYSGSRVMTMHRFWAQNNSFAPNKNFFGKIISPSSTYWPLSLCKIFKKILVDPELRGCAIHFSEKTVSKPCSFHSCLSTCHESVRYWSVNEILTVKEYWNFIGQEPFRL